MSRLLQSLPRIVARAAGPVVFFDATLTRYAHPTDTASPARDPWDPATPVETTYDCRAVVVDYDERLRLAGTVKESERKVLILSTSLSVTPQVGDKIEVDGYGEAVAMRVTADPARAVWEIHSEWQRTGGA